VIVLVCFQQVARIYEVILVNVKDDRELSRFYVTRAEITFQLHQRKLNAAVKRLAECLSSPVALTGPISRLALRRRGKSAETEKFVSPESEAQQQEDEAMGDIAPMDTESTSEQLFVTFPQLIVKGLRHVDGRYLLFNEITSCEFKITSSLPLEVATSQPYCFEKNDLTKVKNLRHLEHEMTSLRASVSAVDVLSVTTCVHLEESNQKSTSTYVNEKSVNPNQSKYRLLWKRAISHVLQKLKKDRSSRDKWTTLMSLSRRGKQDLASTDIVPTLDKGSHRRFAVKKHQLNKGATMVTLEDIAKYREELNVKRQLKMKSSVVNTT